MTSKEFELIKEMLQMQAKLDEAIMKEYGLNEIDEENSKLKNGELYVEMQKKSLMNSLNNTKKKNSSSDIVLTDPNNYEYVNHPVVVEHNFTSHHFMRHQGKRCNNTMQKPRQTEKVCFFLRRNICDNLHIWRI